MQSLSPQDHETYLDVTFGQGGHARAILNTAQCSLIASDRDTLAQKAAEKLSQEKLKGQFLGCSLNRFSDITDTLQHHGIKSVDGLIADFGLSSPQINNPERGFSFKHDGPLDMRMGENTLSAQEFIASSDEQELSFTFKHYGEERFAKSVARAIVKARQVQAITSTLQLAHIVRSAIPHSSQKIDPATRTFQAIRIVVNSELNEIKALLNASPHILKAGARIVIISFHSLEDRLVKQFFRQHAQNHPHINRHLPSPPDFPPPLFSLPFHKPLSPSQDEININPRARSARLRLALRTHAPS